MNPLADNRQFIETFFEATTGFNSIFRKIQDLYDKYLSRIAGLNPVQEYWYLINMRNLSKKWLAERGNDQGKKQLLEQFVPMLEERRNTITPDVLKQLNDRKIALLREDKDLTQSILSALTLDTLIDAYVGTTQGKVFDDREAAVLRYFISKGQITLGDTREEFSQRLNYLLATGFNKRGEGSMATQMLGGGLSVTVGFDVAKLFVPIGLEASITIDLEGKAAAAQVIGFERQNENPEEPDLAPFSLMDMAGFTGALKLGAKLTLSAGPKVSTDDLPLALEVAALELGAGLEASVGAGVRGTYLVVTDPKPRSIMGVAEAEPFIFRAVNKKPKFLRPERPASALLEQWSLGFEVGAEAEAKAGVTAKSDILQTDIFLGARGNITAKGTATLSNYRYQSITGPSTRLIKTQDTRVVVKQVGVDTSALVGGEGRAAGFTFEKGPSANRSFDLINSVAFEAGIALWDPATQDMKPGSGYVIGVSLSPGNMDQYYISQEGDYVTTVARALQVEPDRVESLLDDDEFRQLYADVTKNPALNPRALFMEASFALPAPGKVLLDKEGRMDPSLRSTLRDQAVTGENLQSLRVCYRREDQRDNSRQVFKLGFNLGAAKLGISLGKVATAGVSEMINIYEKPFAAQSSSGSGKLNRFGNEAPPKNEPNQDVIRAQLFL